MRKIILLFFLSLSFQGQAQTSIFKLFIDDGRNVVDSSHALFYSIYTTYDDSIRKSGMIKTYFMNGTLLSKTEYTDNADNSREETTIYFYGNGKTESVSKTIDGKKNGKFLSYYPSGILKREDLYDNDKMRGGKCYDEKGTETFYYPTRDERLAEFPGGEDELIKFIATNIKYPEKAKRKKISGTVLVHFVIDKKGNVKQIEIVKSVDPLLDAEAIRVISSMPQWIPGFKKDQALSVIHTSPVVFKLDK